MINIYIYLFYWLKVRKYEEAVKQGDDPKNLKVGSPNILADIVEALAGAVYLDLNLDLTKLWTVRFFRLFFIRLIKFLALQVQGPKTILSLSEW